MSNQIGSVAAAPAKWLLCFFLSLSVCCSAKPQFQTEGGRRRKWGLLVPEPRKHCVCQLQKISLHVGRKQEEAEEETTEAPKLHTQQ